jgi:ribosomal protein S18 acetylase RimI-like enzyme
MARAKDRWGTNVNIVPLDSSTDAATLAYVRRDPYRNALLLANVSQLRDRCDVIVACDDGQIRGAASTYHDLPIPALTFAAEERAVGPLLHALAARNPRLRGDPAWALLPPDRCELLARHADIVETTQESQMVIGPAQVAEVNAVVAARRLTAEDLPAMERLARKANLGVWHRRALTVGPAFGCDVDSGLVSMGGTHFVTPEFAEIGHIGTDPAFRGRGLAASCTRALVLDLLQRCPRVILHVVDSNRNAVSLYRRVGFKVNDRMLLTHFRLA